MDALSQLMWASLFRYGEQGSFYRKSHSGPYVFDQSWCGGYCFSLSRGREASMSSRTTRSFSGRMISTSRSGWGAM